jgi:hypothetical protein
LFFIIIKEFIIKQIYSILKKANHLLKIKVLLFLVIMIIIICYYIFIFKYILNINDVEITTCTTSSVEIFKSTEKVSNIWYKFIFDDFFSKFTIYSKTIDHKYFEMQLSISPLIIEHNQNILKESVLYNINSNHIYNPTTEYGYYKQRINYLETQIHYTKMIHNNLINDLYDILKDINK